MKTNFIAGFLSGALIFGAAGVLAAGLIANPNPFPIMLNGESVSMEGYNIEGSTYFKLRDIAEVVGGFGVNFNDNTIQLSKDGYLYATDQNSSQDVSTVLSAPLTTADEVRKYYTDGDIYADGNFYARVDSAGGVYLNLCAKNISDKPIKYITFIIRLYNPVGDQITDEDGNSEFMLQLVGPLNAGEGFRYLSNMPFAYTYACGKLSIDEMSIEFMDGTVVSGVYGHSTTIIRN